MADASEFFMEPRVSIVTLGVSSVSRSIAFYRDGLGFPLTQPQEGDYALFATGGVRVALYPFDKLLEDIGDHELRPREPATLGGITLAHNTRRKEDVDVILARASAAGGRLLKNAEDTFWGGYSGYFRDPDGYPWEVAWADFWQFDDRGQLWGGPLGPPPDRVR